MDSAQYPSLKDKSVLVTGAARGIGAAIAIAFAAQGARLVLDDLPERSAQLAEVAKKAEAFGVPVKMVIADIRDEAQVAELVAAARETYGKIDVLVNNAGIVYDLDWDTKTKEQWHDTLDTNLVGPYLLIRAAKDMLLASKGVVVNITSTNGYKAMNPFSLDYDASKAGLITLTHNAAAAMAPDVRVNAIAPGWVNTTMNSDLAEEIVDKETGKIFAGRFAEPHEIASVAVFLASDDARYINGTTVTVDGGYQ